MKFSKGVVASSYGMTQKCQREVRQLLMSWRWLTKKLKLEINELKKGTSYGGAGEYNDVLDDGNNNHVIMQFNDEIHSLNRKFRIAIVVVVCTWIVMMSMWLM